MEDIVRYRCDDQVARVAFNRPKRMNALTVEIFDHLSDAFDTAVADGARALILTGEGRAFCTGFDLSDRTIDECAENGRRWFDTVFTPLFVKLAELPIPIVTAVNGPAAGAGCSLALYGDFVIAARSAYFFQSFANIGLVPDAGATWLLPRLIGLQRANRMMMLGEKISAEQAEQWGMIHSCVDDDALAGTANALATRLANGATASFRSIRQGVRYAQTSTFRDALEREASDQTAAFNRADCREGIAAFHEGRKPDFRRPALHS